MEVGIGIFNGISFEKQVEYFKKYGINRTFVGSDITDFDHVMGLFKENGIICETLHAPFGGINAMWGEDEEAAAKMMDQLKDSVDKCARYNIPVTIVHLSSGRPMPEVNERGAKRYEEIFRYAKENGVIIALENQRYLENLQYFMDHYQTPGFCWDNGHEYGATKGIRFMDHFGNRVVALHIHDNRCGTDTDDHLLPFDGKIDFDVVAKDLAQSGYSGTLMLEVGKLVSIDGKRVYEDLTDEEYVERAALAAQRLAVMVENRKKS